VKIGHACFAASHTVITRSQGCRSSPFNPRGVWPDQSIPSSASAATARRLTRPAGTAPALAAANRPPPSVVSSASAIWLRAELAVHTNNTRNGISVVRLSVLE
jgi:hypothetical protein